MSDMCDPCYAKMQEAVTCRHPDKRRVGLSGRPPQSAVQASAEGVRDPIFGTGPKAERAARLRREFGENLGFLVATNCISEKQAGEIRLKNSPAGQRVAIRKEIEEQNIRNNLPAFTEEQMESAINLAIEMEV